MTKPIFILWDYKANDTLSYVWGGFYKALKYLGYEAYWLDQYDCFEFDKNKQYIFICEHFKTSGLPLIQNGTYLVHTLMDYMKYQGVGRLIDMRYNCDYQDHETNYNYVLHRPSCKKLGPLVHWDHNSKGTTELLYVAWATDLLPHEFNFSDAEYKRQAVYNFIGTLYTGKYENQSTMKGWLDACTKSSIKYNHVDPWVSPVSNERNRELIRESFLAPDIRGPQNINCGYIPCRIFKNISYGQLGLTNSRAVHAAMDEMTLYHADTATLFELGLNNMHNYKLIKSQMRYVQENHTYINRVKAILKIL